MTEIVRADQLGEECRPRLGEIFADGFAKDLTYFTADRARLARALAHMFVLPAFYVALVDDEPASMVACEDGSASCVRLRWRPLVRHLGLVKGTVAATFLRREFQRLPNDRGPRRGFPAFPATAEEHRGKGLATALLQHVLELPEFDEYILDEVADINTPALKLYEKLGFEEYRRTAVNHTARTGIREYVSLRYVERP